MEQKRLEQIGWDPKKECFIDEKGLELEVELVIPPRGTYDSSEDFRFLRSVLEERAPQETSLTLVAE